MRKYFIFSLLLLSIGNLSFAQKADTVLIPNYYKQRFINILQHIDSAAYNGRIDAYLDPQYKIAAGKFFKVNDEFEIAILVPGPNHSNDPDDLRDSVILRTRSLIKPGICTGNLEKKINKAGILNFSVNGFGFNEYETLPLYYIKENDLSTFLNQSDYIFLSNMMQQSFKRDSSEKEDGMIQWIVYCKSITSNNAFKQGAMVDLQMMDLFTSMLKNSTIADSFASIDKKGIITYKFSKQTLSKLKKEGFDVEKDIKISPVAIIDTLNPTNNRVGWKFEASRKMTEKNILFSPLKECYFIDKETLLANNPNAMLWADLIFE